MAKKKETKEEKDDTEITKNTTNFDWRKALDSLVKPNMFKAGLGYYIQSRNLNPSSEKDLNKIVEQYGNLTLGE